MLASQYGTEQILLHFSFRIVVTVVFSQTWKHKLKYCRIENIGVGGHVLTLDMDTLHER